VNRPVAGAWVRSELAAVAAEQIGGAVNQAIAGGTLLVNAAWLAYGQGRIAPAPAVGICGDGVAYVHCDDRLAQSLSPPVCLDSAKTSAALESVQRIDAPGQLIRYPWHLVHANADMLRCDCADSGEIEGKVYPGAYLLNPSEITVRPGSTIMPGAVLNAEDGPIHIGENVTISANTVIHGPCAVGDGSLIQPGASIGEGTTLGPVCKVGGELEESIIHGYSNKQHDGFLGHAYIGEWVNLAADTVNSDLKNTYGSVRVPVNGVEVDSGEMFVGLTMADHCKTGITQAFGTGSVVGFASMVATSCYPPAFVPSFRWITDKADEPYDPQRCLAVARKVMARRKKEISTAQAALFLQIPALAGRFEKTG
jgi:UDP-N-acetylglucosamine diphosphorylase/glucosamine-1-phosphate N-acetyltransferase